MARVAKNAQVSGGDGRVDVDVLAEARKSCYKVRDAFYACLEKGIDKKPTEIASVGLLYPSDCKQARAEFVSRCRSTWEHFWCRVLCLLPTTSQWRRTIKLED